MRNDMHEVTPQARDEPDTILFSITHGVYTHVALHLHARTHARGCTRAISHALIPPYVQAVKNTSCFVHPDPDPGPISRVTFFLIAHHGLIYVL